MRSAETNSRCSTNQTKEWNSQLQRKYRSQKRRTQLMQMKKSMMTTSRWATTMTILVRSRSILRSESNPNLQMHACKLRRRASTKAAIKRTTSMERMSSSDADEWIVAV